MDNSEETIVITPKPLNRFYLLFTFLCLTYYNLQVENTYSIFARWLLMIIGLPLAVLYFVFQKKYDKASTITLSPEGFRIGEKLHHWHNIEHFGVAYRGIIFKHEMVVWNYRPTSPNIEPTQKTSRLLHGYGDGLSRDYEIKPENMARLFNTWRTRYTGQRANISIYD